MEQEIVKEVLHNSSDISLWGLFLQADIVVKLVMLILLLASIWCWTIIIEKIFLSRKEIKLANTFENEFWSGTSLDDIYDEMSNENNEKQQGAISRVFSSAMQEWRRANTSGLVSKGDNFKASLSQRIERGMSVAITREIGRLEGYDVFSFYWFGCSIYRFIWNSMGNNELILGNCSFQKYIFSCCCARYCRGTICNSIGTFSSYPCSCSLQ